MMEYKGYHAAVKYDDDDRIFVGEVFGINDSVNFHGESVDALEESFHRSVDDYLDICAQIGKEPDKEFNGDLTVTMTPELHRMASLEAARRNVSLDQLIVSAVMDAVSADAPA